jgi:hypothetical protein
MTLPVSEGISSQVSTLGDVRIIDERVTIAPPSRKSTPPKAIQSEIIKHPDALSKKSFSCLELLKRIGDYIYKILCCAWFSQTKTKTKAAEEATPPKQLPPMPVGRNYIGVEGEGYKTWNALSNDLHRMADMVKADGSVTEALVIYGDGNLQINDDPGILRFNPMKLILVGAKLVHEPSSAGAGRLDDQLSSDRRPEWKGSGFRACPGTFTPVEEVASVKEALSKQHTRMKDGRFFHRIYYVSANPTSTNS